MDISLLFQPGSPVADIAVNGTDLDTNRDLETAVIMSLFTDRRAEEDDEPTEANRRGWWGDTFSIIDSDRIGSRLWLLGRSKEIQPTVNLAQIYAEEALQWLIEDSIAEAVNVTASIVRSGVLGLEIEVVKPDGVQILYYQRAWTQQ